MTSSRRPRRFALLISLALCLALAACGSDEQPAPTTSTAEAPTPDRDEGDGGDGNGGEGGEAPPVGDGEGGVRLEQIATLEGPVWVTQPPGEDSDLYVVQQCGEIVRLPGGDGDPEPFLDISDQVTCGGEQGLLSLAFAPDFARSGLLYVYFTDLEERQRLVEYTASPERADPESAREVISFDDPYANHNGGLLVFGPDEQLWIGSGDGGGAGDPERTAQDPSSPLGKLLRIDPQGSGEGEFSIPRDNPFAGGGGLEPVMALGLRNPWRFSFDRETGDLWIGDVGQDSQEEIDAVELADAAGANFGWSAFEGTEPFNDDQEAPGAIEPVHTYSHDDGGCSVTGGYVVRDPELESLYGRYLYGDFCTPELRSFTAEPGREATDDRPLGIEVPGLTSFGTDNAGTIYATASSGEVFRLAAD